MTQEDIIELREKNMPQWRKDQLDAQTGNIDYINSLKCKIGLLEDKLKSHLEIDNTKIQNTSSNSEAEKCRLLFMRTST